MKGMKLIGKEFYIALLVLVVFMAVYAFDVDFFTSEIGINLLSLIWIPIAAVVIFFVFKYFLKGVKDNKELRQSSDNTRAKQVDKLNAITEKYN